ncbi:MAG: hypothetical protein WC222_05155 [Parachlamydiales bacterium]|jgi:hypothetical protein
MSFGTNAVARSSKFYYTEDPVPVSDTQYRNIVLQAFGGKATDSLQFLSVQRITHALSSANKPVEFFQNDEMATKIAELKYNARNMTSQQILSALGV